MIQTGFITFPHIWNKEFLQSRAAKTIHIGKTQQGDFTILNNIMMKNFGNRRGRVTNLVLLCLPLLDFLTTLNALGLQLVQCPQPPLIEYQRLNVTKTNLKKPSHLFIGKVVSLISSRISCSHVVGRFWYLRINQWPPIHVRGFNFLKARKKGCKFQRRQRKSPRQYILEFPHIVAHWHLMLIKQDNTRVLFPYLSKWLKNYLPFQENR
jgi:hypothetical protein